MSAVGAEKEGAGVTTCVAVISEDASAVPSVSVCQCVICQCVRCLGENVYGTWDKWHAEVRKPQRLHEVESYAQDMGSMKHQPNCGFI